MSVKLISKNEKFVYRHNGCEVYYRRIPNNEKTGIIRKNTNRNSVDYTEVGLDICRAGILGWTGIQDETGKQVSYDPELINQLPEELIIDLVTAMNASDGERYTPDEKKADDNKADEKK